MNVTLTLIAFPFFRNTFSIVLLIRESGNIRNPIVFLKYEQKLPFLMRLTVSRSKNKFDIKIIKMEVLTFLIALERSS